MTLVPFNKNDIDRIEVDRRDNEKVKDMLIEFVTSDNDCVEVTDHRYPNALTCRSSIACTIKHLGLRGVKARTRAGRVFLIKEQ